MRCKYCQRYAIYRCRACGRPLCTRHARLGTVCPPSAKKKRPVCTIRRATSREAGSTVRSLVKRFWGEEEQLLFDSRFRPAELPTYLAEVKNRTAGFVSLAETHEAVVVVALAVLPEYQGSGVGRRLIQKVEAEAKNLRKNTVLVATSNDDLPALAFYQSLGFQLFEVRPNVVAEKHGGIVTGIARLPVRDELRLRKCLG